jgi:hypothetical protein
MCCSPHALRFHTPKLRRAEVYDVRTIYTDSGTIAGYAFKRPTWHVWGAIRPGYCEYCAPEKHLGAFSDLRFRGRRAGQPVRDGNATMIARLSGAATYLKVTKNE